MDTAARPTMRSPCLSPRNPSSSRQAASCGHAWKDSEASEPTLVDLCTPRPESVRKPNEDSRDMGTQPIVAQESWTRKQTDEQVEMGMQYQYSPRSGQRQACKIPHDAAAMGRTEERSSRSTGKLKRPRGSTATRKQDMPRADSPSHTSFDVFTFQAGHAVKTASAAQSLCHQVSGGTQPQQRTKNDVASGISRPASPYSTCGLETTTGGLIIAAKQGQPAPRAAESAVVRTSFQREKPEPPEPVSMSRIDARSDFEQDGERRRITTKDCNARAANKNAVKKKVKRKVKSEAIVIDSDDPDSNAEERSRGCKPACKRTRIDENDAPRDRANLEKTRMTDSTPQSRVHLRADSCERRLDDNAIERSIYFKETGVRPLKVLHERPMETGRAHPNSSTRSPEGRLNGSAGPLLPDAPSPPLAATNIRRGQSDSGSPGANLGQSREFGDEITSMEISLRRRRSWTPVKDTAAGARLDNNMQNPENNSPESSALRLKDALEGYGHVEPDARKNASSVLTHSGKHATTSRRIQLAEPVAGSTDEQSLAHRKIKRVKAPAKKAQTITALATSAYRSARDQSSGVDRICELLGVPKTDAAGKSLEETMEPGQNGKKVRKPRRKKVTVEGEPATNAIAKNARSIQKAKSHAKKPLHKLHFPERAIAQLAVQGFLFGTSSQLAVEEPSSFISDVQDALRESEMDRGNTRAEPMRGNVLSSQSVPNISQCERSRLEEEISCTRVPTAPHGTSLSVGQGTRDLWCIAARDAIGGTVRNEFFGTTTLADHAPRPLADPELQRAAMEQRIQSPAQAPAQFDEGDYTPEPRQFETIRGELDHRDLPQHSVIDLCGTSPASEGATKGPRKPDSPLPDRSFKNHNESTPLVDKTMADLSVISDEPCVDVPCKRPKDEASRDVRLPLSPLSKRPQRPVFQYIEPIRMRPEGQLMANSPTRPALQSLNANISTMACSPSKSVNSQQTRTHVSANLPSHSRGEDATASGEDSQTVAKKRGRPRKDSNMTNAAVTGTAMPKQRGRPRKETSQAPGGVTAARPRKRDQLSAVSSAVAISKAPVKTAPRFKNSGLLPLTSPEYTSQGSKWHDIDEISDSEVECTPSPPRRSAHLPPSAIPPLEVKIVPSSPANPQPAAQVPLALSATLKAGDTHWALISAWLFPQITKTIKSAPRNKDPADPTWYQKILLYDPIVIEELTSWLNEQGLRVERQRPKPKAAKKRGRKKKGAPDEIGASVSEEGVELESIEDPLQAWMVQKWCQEQSVCCVWSGGGWSGRRQ